MSSVALLRALNVGPNNRIRMVELVALFEAAGARDVTTYIQSGNVRFSARSPSAVASKVEAALKARGIASPVVLRTDEELQQALTRNPFLAEGQAPETLHVAFLKTVPAAAAAAALDPQRSPPDRMALIGRDLYLHLPKGVGNSKITNTYLDATLKTVSTVRNWKTTEALVAMAQVPEGAGTPPRQAPRRAVTSRKR